MKSVLTSYHVKEETNHFNFYFFFHLKGTEQIESFSFQLVIVICVGKRLWLS